MNKFYALLLNTAPRPIPTEAIEAQLNKEINWLRLASTQYIVRSSLQTAKELFDKLRPLTDEKDNILVIELQKNNRHGWVSTIAADWMRNSDKPA